MRSSSRGSTRASMYDWSLTRVEPARKQETAAMLDDPCVVTCREGVCAGAVREREQAAKRKPPLQWMHGLGVSPRS